MNKGEPSGLPVPFLTPNPFVVIEKEINDAILIVPSYGG